MEATRGGGGLSVHGATCGRSELNVLIIALVRGCRFFYGRSVETEDDFLCVLTYKSEQIKLWHRRTNGRWGQSL